MALTTTVTATLTRRPGSDPNPTSRTNPDSNPDSNPDRNPDPPLLLPTHTPRPSRHPLPVRPHAPTDALSTSCGAPLRTPPPYAPFPTHPPPGTSPKPKAPSSLRPRSRTRRVFTRPSSVAWSSWPSSRPWCSSGSTRAAIKLLGLADEPARACTVPRPPAPCMLSFDSMRSTVFPCELRLVRHNTE